MKADLSFVLKNPDEMLEQLRRSSVLEFEHLKSPDHPQPPLRKLPEHSVPKPSTSVQHHVGPGSPMGGSEDVMKEIGFAPGRDAKPVFKELHFGNDGTSDGDVENSTEKASVGDVVSPTAPE
jgi:glycogenin glucosyltransferase